MDKSHFFQRLLATLREELLHAVNASKDAAEYATNEESRAESQWDTQGLEASYLAAGQATQARQWAEAVEERSPSLHPPQGRWWLAHLSYVLQRCHTSLVEQSDREHRQCT